MKSDGPALFACNPWRPACVCGRCEESITLRAALYMLQLSVTLLDDPAVTLYFGRATRDVMLLTSEATFVIDSIGRV